MIFLRPPILFGLVFLVYFSNFFTLLIPDTIPTSISYFNLIQFGTFYFDNLCQSDITIVTTNIPVIPLEEGHIGTFYPIGMTILSLPIYIIYAVVISISGVSIDLLSPTFEQYRQVGEKIACCFLAALSVQFLALALIKRFGTRTALVATFSYAFATNFWFVGSTNLWQHVGINVLLSGVLLLFISARDDRGRIQNRSIFLIGLILGLLPSVRPTAIVYSLAIVFALRSFRSWLWGGIMIGMTPTLVWNIYFFGNPLGGYFTTFGSTLTQLTLDMFIRGAWGLLFDPFRGLLVFSPFLLFLPLGIFLLLKNEKEVMVRRTVGYLTLASGLLFLYYSVNKYWQGGYVYGPRYLLDSVPIWILLLSYVIGATEVWNAALGRGTRILLYLLILVAFGFQFIGVYQVSWPQWEGHPFVLAATNYWPNGFPAPNLGGGLEMLCKNLKVTSPTTPLGIPRF